MIWFRRCDSRLTMCTSFLSSSSSGANRASSFSAPVMAVSGWRISCAIAAESRPKRRHAFFGNHFPFQALQFRQILEVINETHVLVLRRAQRRNRKAQKRIAPFASLEFNFLSRWPADCPARPLPRAKSREKCLAIFSPRMQSQAGTGDFRAGAIHDQDRPSQIRGEQAAAHGFDDVLVESLQVFQFLAFFLKFHAFLRSVCASKLPR